jgi:glycosyltransferase 28-like protein
MIFVSLGTQDKPFNRIIDYVLSLKEEVKELEELEDAKIVFQIGQTKLSEEEKNKIIKLNNNKENKEEKNKNNKENNKEDITVFNMLKPEEMKKYIIDSSFVITHAGVGTIMECVENNKEIVVLPRKEKYAEHVNNHQEEIASEMEKNGLLKKVDTYDKLKEVVIEIIRNRNNKKENIYVSNNEKFNDKLIEYLEGI